jgi:AcrR family transcriptional regulator
MPDIERKARQALHAAHRKSQILHAAFGCCSKKGIATMTMDDVSHAARLSKGLPFYYFKSKQRLLLAMLDLFSDTVVGEVSAILGDTDSEADALRQLAVSFVEALTVKCRHPEMLIEFWTLALRDREIAERLRHIRENTRTSIEAILRRSVELRTLTCEDVSSTAQILYAALLGIASQWVLSDRASDPVADTRAVVAGLLANLGSDNEHGGAG